MSINNVTETSLNNYTQFKEAYDLIKITIEIINNQKSLPHNQTFLSTQTLSEGRTGDALLKDKLKQINLRINDFESLIKKVENNPNFTHEPSMKFDPNSKTLLTDLIVYITEKTANFERSDKYQINEITAEILPLGNENLRTTLTTQVLQDKIINATKKVNPKERLNLLNIIVEGQNKYREHYEEIYNAEVSKCLTEIKGELLQKFNLESTSAEQKLQMILGSIYGVGSTSGILNENHRKMILDAISDAIIKPLETAIIQKIVGERTPLEIDELDRLNGLSKIYEHSEPIKGKIEELKITTTNDLVNKIRDLSKNTDIIYVLKNIDLNLKGNLKYPNEEIRKTLLSIANQNINNFERNLKSILNNKDITDVYQKLHYVDMLIKLMNNEKLANSKIVKTTQKELVIQAINNLEKEINKSNLDTFDKIHELRRLANELGVPNENRKKLEELQAVVENHVVKNLQAESISLMAAIDISEFNNVSAFADKKKQHEIPNLSKCIAFQENVTYSLLKYMFTSQNPTEIASRLGQVIRMANQFSESNNYYMFAACMNALTNTAINNLSKVVKMLPENEQKLYASLTDLYSPIGAFRNLKSAYSTSLSNSTFIPSLSVLTGQLTNFSEVFHKQDPKPPDFDRQFREEIFKLAAPFRSFQVNHASLPISQPFQGVVASVAEVQNTANSVSDNLRASELYKKGKFNPLPKHKQYQSQILDIKSYTQSIPTMTVDEALTDLSKRITAANKILSFENDARNAYKEKVRMAQEQAKMAKEDKVEAATNVEPSKPYQSKLAQSEKRQIKLVSEISQLQKEMLIAARDGDKDSVEKKWKFLISKTFQLYEGASRVQTDNLRSHLNYFQAANKAYYDLANKTLVQRLQAAPVPLVPLQQKAAAAPAPAANIPAATDLQQPAVAPVQVAPPSAKEPVASHAAPIIQQATAVDGKSAQPRVQEPIAASSGVSPVEVAPPRVQEVMAAAAQKPIASASEAAPVVQQSPVAEVQAAQPQEPIDLNQSAEIKLEVITGPAPIDAQPSPAVVQIDLSKNVAPAQSELNKLFDRKLNTKLINANNINDYIADMSTRITAANKVLANDDDAIRANFSLPNDKKLPQLNSEERKNINLVMEFSDTLKTLLEAANSGNDTHFEILMNRLKHYAGRAETELKHNGLAFNYLQEAKTAYVQIASNILQQKVLESSTANIAQTKESKKALEDISKSFEPIKKALNNGNLTTKDKVSMLETLNHIKTQLEPYLISNNPRLKSFAETLNNDITLYADKLNKSSKSRDWIKTLSKLWETFLHYVGFGLPSKNNSTNIIQWATRNPAAKTGHPDESVEAHKDQTPKDEKRKEKDVRPPKIRAINYRDDSKPSEPFRSPAHKRDNDKPIFRP